MSMPKALIISNFPILAWSVAHVFHGQYDVTAKTWPPPEQFASFDADLIVLDITLVEYEAAHQ